jgi:nucleolar protein 56
LAIETPEEKRKRILSLAKEAVTTAYSTGEHALVQGINSYNEIERTRNLLHERLEEWYGIYFPELETGSPEAYARFVMEAGKDKKQAPKELYSKIFKERGDDVMALAQKSIGREPSDAEYAVVRSMAETELGMIRLEEGIDAFLKEKVPLAMPNISYLIDYKLAAELLAKAGSLQKLAIMPASTIQLLGAEKALFRHLRSGSKSPKYGALFKLKEVTVAERWNKGKVARIFATKLSIAARADAISKRFIAKELKEQLEKAVKRIGESPARPDYRPATFRQNPRFGGARPQRRPDFKKNYERNDERPSYRPQERRTFGNDERPAYRKPFERRDERPSYRPSYGSMERKPYDQDRRPATRPSYRPSYGNREERPAYRPYNRYGDDRQRERPPFRKPFERRDERSGERPAYRPSYNTREDRPATRPSYRPFNRFENRPQERPAYGKEGGEGRHPFKPDHSREERFGGVKGRRPDYRKDDGKLKMKKKKGRSV